MRVHHLCCLTMCPPCAPLVGSPGGLFARGTMICHCLLVETPSSGLVLVDTAIGTADCRDPKGRLGGAFASFMLPRHPPEQDTALRQVERLGFRAEDVRHIIVTHLDVDHAGGLADFPEARVHLLQTERDAALSPRTLAESHRYRSAHFAHGPKWEVYAPQGEPWRGFPCVRELRGLPPELLLVPLEGHTRGHCAVAVEAPGGPLLHCGDAYFHRNALQPSQGAVPLGLRLFERTIAVDRAAVRQNHERLIALRGGREVNIFCAHDPEELAREQHRGAQAVSVAS